MASSSHHSSSGSEEMDISDSEDSGTRKPVFTKTPPWRVNARRCLPPPNSETRRILGFSSPSRAERTMSASASAPAPAPAMSDLSHIFQQHILGVAEPSHNTKNSTSSENPNLIAIDMFSFGSNGAQKAPRAFVGALGASANNFAVVDEALDDFRDLSNNISVLEDETATNARDQDDKRIAAAHDILKEISQKGHHPDTFKRAKAHLVTVVKNQENGDIKSMMKGADFPKAVTEWEDRSKTPDGGPGYFSHFHGSPRMAEKYRLMGDDLDLKVYLGSPVYNEADNDYPGTPPTPGGQMMEDHWNERKLITDPPEADYWRSMDPTYHFSKKAYKTAAKLLIGSHRDISLVPGAKAVALSIEILDSMAREEIKQHLDDHTPGCKHPFCLEKRNDANMGLGVLEYDHNEKISKNSGSLNIVVDATVDIFNTVETEEEPKSLRRTSTHTYDSKGHAKSCGHEDCTSRRKASTLEWEALSADEQKEQAETMARWATNTPCFEDADRNAGGVLSVIKTSEAERKHQKVILKEDQKGRAAKRAEAEKAEVDEKAKVERQKEARRQKLLTAKEKKAREMAELEAELAALE